MLMLEMGGTGTDAEGRGTGEVAVGGNEMTRGSGVEVMGVVSIGERRRNRNGGEVNWSKGNV